MQALYHADENNQPRRRKKFPPAKPGHKFCNDCEQEKPVEDFHIRSGKPWSYCIECEHAQDRARQAKHKPRKTPVKPQVTKENHKVCNTCFEEKPYADFQRTQAQKDGYAGRCKACMKDRYNANHDEIQRKRKVNESPRRERIREQQRAHNKTEKARTTRNVYQRAKYAEKRAAREQERLLNPPAPKLTKICQKCAVEKSLDEFPRTKKNKDGRGSYCLICQRASTQTEEYRAKRRARENAKDETYKQAQYAAHKEWRHANITRINERARKQYAENWHYRQRIKKHTQAWLKAHPIWRRERWQRYNARKQETMVAPVDYEKILERDGFFCYICESPILPHHKLDFDHVTPLFPRPGEPQGTHTEDNIRVTHRICNKRKSNRRLADLTDWDRRGPDK